jgi:hypothetical protein
MNRVRLSDIASALLAGHAIWMQIDGQWLRGYMAIVLAIGMQIVRAIDDLKR